MKGIYKNEDTLVGWGYGGPDIDKVSDNHQCYKKKL